MIQEDTMDTLSNLLAAEKERLTELIDQAAHDIHIAPEGKLRVAGTDQKPQYYIVSEKSSRHGIYLSKNNLSLASQLAQRDYAAAFLKLACRRKALIDRFLNVSSLMDVYSKLSPKRKALVSPYILSPEERMVQWLNEHPSYSRVKENELSLVTNNGEKVRSKSEKIIADKLFELGIPYRYEYPLTLGKAKLHPDFMIYDVNNDSDVYLEHLGMMDSPEYLFNVLKRLDLYATYGITVSHGLLLTFETSTKPLNTRYLFELLSPYIPS